MNQNEFSDLLHRILDWWTPFVDRENGGIFTYPHLLKAEVGYPEKVLLMHLRQLYNFSVGAEHGHAGAEEVAHHLYRTLDTVFPEKSGVLFRNTPSRRYPDPDRVGGYDNAYAVICLSRYAAAFADRPAAERALDHYLELADTFTDGDLAERGSWVWKDLNTGELRGKTDNVVIHRCEGAFNLLRALQTAAPDLAEAHREFLVSEIRAMIRFFETRIVNLELGYTVEVLEEDGTVPPSHVEFSQSIAHGFEWLGFLFEVEHIAGISIPFLEAHGKEFGQKILANGLAPNGCYRNNYVPRYRDGPMGAEFWPQVEAILGALWCRHRWGEDAFPLERAERMRRFFEGHMFKAEDLGGGLLSRVSENGVPTDLSTGSAVKCDHHAVRMCEKILDYGLLDSGNGP